MSQENPTLYSHHIFIFPFKWHLCQKRPDFGSRTDLTVVQENLGKLPISSITELSWKRFKFDWDRDYNEAIYFHSHVRDVLFDKGDDKCNTVLQYHISGKTDLQYRIHLQVEAGRLPKNYTLDIEEITLSIYDTGIGFFAFHLNNYQHNTPEELLKINDFGRRIYPQFLGGEDLRLVPPKRAFLADKIEILLNDKSIVSDDFSAVPELLKKTKGTNDHFLIPRFIQSVLPQYLSSAKNVDIRPLLDDRMHVICWVGDKKWLDNLGSFERDQDAGLYWHSLIFVDGSVTNGTGNHQQILEYNKKHTYKRWIDESLFYGISRYSFVILANGEEDFHRKVVLKHLQTMYFQIVLLSLLQRGSIVRFSEEITRLTQSVTSGAALRRSSEGVKSLYAKYLEFVNKIYFREVTPQEQGIELYKMVQENMEIERDVKALQSEIHDFFHLLDLKANEQQVEAFNTLTIIGSGLLIPSLILAYYGISEFPELQNKADFAYHWTPAITLTGMLAGLFGSWAWIQCRGQKPEIRRLAGLVLVAVLVFVFWIVIKSPQWYYEIKH